MIVSTFPSENDDASVSDKCSPPYNLCLLRSNKYHQRRIELLNLRTTADVRPQSPVFLFFPEIFLRTWELTFWSEALLRHLRYAPPLIGCQDCLGIVMEAAMEKVGWPQYDARGEQYYRQRKHHANSNHVTLRQN